MHAVKTQAPKHVPLHHPEQLILALRLVDHLRKSIRNLSRRGWAKAAEREIV